MPSTDQMFAISVSNGSDCLVKVRPDGTIEYGPNYKPDESAKAFWEAVAKEFPIRLDAVKWHNQTLEEAALRLESLAEETGEDYADCIWAVRGMKKVAH